MSVTMKISNKERLFRRLKAVAPEAQVTLGEAAAKGAEDIALAASRFVPVLTGALGESIEVTRAGQATPPYSHPGGSFVVPEGAAAVTVGNTAVRYGHLVEYGTAEAPAQPFFWPAYRMLRRSVRSRMTRALTAAVKRAMKKP